MSAESSGGEQGAGRRGGNGSQVAAAPGICQVIDIDKDRRRTLERHLTGRNDHRLRPTGRRAGAGPRRRRPHDPRRRVEAELTALLAPHFTVYSYDRRGRGESGDTQPYAVDREIDDIDALITHAGGRAYLSGHSSGACLALDAARALGGEKVARVGAYEPPWNDDPAVEQAWSAYLRGLAEALESGRRGDAVALFMEYLGTPAEQIAGMRRSPFWSSFEAIAPTLAYDHAQIIGPSMAGAPASPGRFDRPGPCDVRHLELSVHVRHGAHDQRGGAAGQRSDARRADARRAAVGAGPVLIDFFEARAEGSRAA